MKLIKHNARTYIQFLFISIIVHFQIINDKDSYPLNLKFGRPTMTTNDEIVLASMFYSLYAMAVQLSPDQGSSGINELETDTFKLYCSQTVTGVKFIVVCDPKQMGIDQLLDKIYELYADFALKNPFYSLEMPIRADLFDQNLQVAIDQIERTGFIWHPLSSKAHFIVLHSINKYPF